MRRLFVMHIGPAAAYLSKHVIFAHDTQNGFQVDILSDLALDLASYTAAAIGLFAALLTICDEIDQPLIFCHSVLPVSLCVVTAAGYLKYSNIASTLYLPRNRSMTRYFSLTSCQLRQKISQQLHLHTQFHQFIATTRFFVRPILSGTAFWAWDIPVGYLFRFIVLARDELFDLLERQAITLRYFQVRFSCCFSPEHFFTQYLYFLIRPGHNDDLLSYVYSTTRGLFFYCSFFRILNLQCKWNSKKK